MVMQSWLLLLSILKVIAIKVIFEEELPEEAAAKPAATPGTEPPASDATESIAKPRVVCECSHSSLAHLERSENSFLTELASRISKKVYYKADKAEMLGQFNPLYTRAVKVLIKSDVKWESVQALLQIIDGSAEEFHPEIKNEEALKLVEVCQKLGIQDQGCLRRIWRAFCADKQFQAETAYYRKYLKTWINIFCDADLYVSDNAWLDLFRDMRRRDFLQYCTVGTIKGILSDAYLSGNRFLQDCSQLIKTILLFIEEGGPGLVIPHTLFLRNSPLSGRFGEIVDLVEYISNGRGVIFSGPVPLVLPKDIDECHDKVLVENGMQICIYTMGHNRLFVSGHLHHVTTPAWIHEVLVELLPNRVTHLFLNIPEGKRKVWDTSAKNTADVVSILATQPLSYLWIYCERYKQEFIEKAAECLPNLKRLITVQDRRCTDKNAHPSTEVKTHRRIDYYPNIGCACDEMKKPCISLWRNFLLNEVSSSLKTRHPTFITICKGRTQFD